MQFSIQINAIDIYIDQLRKRKKNLQSTLFLLQKAQNPRNVSKIWQNGLNQWQ